MVTRSLRVLHCPTTTGGNPQNLAVAERQLGAASWAVAFCQNYLGYRCDEVLWDVGTPLWKQQFKCWHLLVRALREFNVIHYNGGTPILPWDIPPRLLSPKGDLRNGFLRGYTGLCRLAEQNLLTNKVVGVTYQGDDARQGDFSRQNFPVSIAQEVGDDYYSTESDARKRQRIAWFDHHADLIYALNPDLLHVLPRRATFMPYANVDMNLWQPVGKILTDIPLVLHAPSHRGAKGTRFILAAVDRLHAEGVSFEFILVENLSNAEARKLYERADLVIDQLLAGWYGGFAVEAMALGKPVVCYLREGDLGFLPVKMREQMPLIRAEPDDIYKVLRNWLTTRRHELAERGAASRAYVEYWHDPVRIAGSLLEDYRHAAKAKNLSWAEGG